MRQEERPDAYTVREATFAELELLYDEYTRPAVAATDPKPKKRASKRKTAGKTKGKVRRKKH